MKNWEGMRQARSGKTFEDPLLPLKSKTTFSLFFSLKVYLYHMYDICILPACMSVQHMCTASVCRGQKRASDPLDLEWQVGICQVGAGNGTQVFSKIHFSSLLIYSSVHSTNTYATLLVHVPGSHGEWTTVLSLVAGLRGKWLLGSMWRDRLKMAYGEKAGSDMLCCFLVRFSIACVSSFYYKRKCQARFANASSVWLVLDAVFCSLHFSLMLGN